MEKTLNNLKSIDMPNIYAIKTEVPIDCDIIKKLTIDEFSELSDIKMLKYIIIITQTYICEDDKYCEMILNIWRKKL